MKRILLFEHSEADVDRADLAKPQKLAVEALVNLAGVSDGVVPTKLPPPLAGGILINTGRAAGFAGFRRTGNRQADRILLAEPLQIAAPTLLDPQAIRAIIPAIEVTDLWNADLELMDTQPIIQLAYLPGLAIILLPLVTVAIPGHGVGLPLGSRSARSRYCDSEAIQPGARGSPRSIYSRQLVETAPAQKFHTLLSHPPQDSTELRRLGSSHS
ncbi:MAG: hypothetical protein KDD11_08195 [Acidobacteria bacterium]|nr:hypothetical protein [Acidobacteriota bacterium]